VNLEQRLASSDPDGFERGILENVRDHGWSVVLIPEDQEGPGFAFTVGLEHSFDHPELVMIGQKLENMHGIINAAGERIRGGDIVQTGVPTDNVLEGYDAVFLEIDQTHFPEWLGTARWFYGGDNFRALQLVYPDRLSRFPWDAGVHPDFVAAQPILGTIDQP
jgi:hypothetical protein